MRAAVDDRDVGGVDDVGGRECCSGDIQRGVVQCAGCPDYPGLGGLVDEGEWRKSGTGHGGAGGESVAVVAVGSRAVAPENRDEALGGCSSQKIEPSQ